MKRIDHPTATEAGKFTEGNPAQGVLSTRVTAEWLNTVQEELVNAVLVTGGELDPDKQNQLAAVLAAHFGNEENPHKVTPAQIGAAPVDHTHPQEESGLAPVRQAIMACVTDAVSGLPDFLVANGSGVTVKAEPDPLVLSFADGERDYIERIVADVAVGAETLINDATNYIFAERGEDGVVSVGTTVDAPVYTTGTPMLSGLDLFPAATSNAWAGVGVISASSELDSLNAGWHAFDHLWASTNDDWCFSVSNLPVYLRVNMEVSRVLMGYEVVGVPTGTASFPAAPKNWEIKVGAGDVPDTVVDTVSEETNWGQGEKRRFFLAEPRSCKSFELNVLANNGDTQCRVLEFIPLFAPAWAFDLTTYKATSQRVYLGEADVAADGALSSVYSYAPGVYTVRGINSGNDVTANTRYVEKNPFGINAPTLVCTEIFINNMWGDPGWMFDTGTNRGFGVRGGCVLGTGIVIQAGSYQVASYSSYAGGLHNYSGNVASAPGRIRVRRSF